MAEATYDGAPLPMDLPPLPIAVFRWHPAAGDQDTYLEPLPHVAFEECSWYEGPRPPDCLLRYVVHPMLPFEWLLPFGGVVPPPDPWESPESQGDQERLPVTPSWVLRQDDRIVVATVAVDGTPRYLFDGFVEMPGLGLSPSGAAVPIRAVGVAKRLWDTVLLRSPWRDAQGAAPGEEPRVVETWVPARFNPDGRYNCAGETDEQESPSGYPYPVFTDPVASDGLDVSSWSLDRAVRLILGRGNPYQVLVKNPPKEELERLLWAAEPADEAVPIDPDDPDTYELFPVPAPDRVVGDLPLPEALAAVIAGRGFAFKFALRTGSDGWPENYVQFYPTRGPLPGGNRVLKLQPQGQQLDPSRTNLASAQLQRDGTGIVNVWRARIAPLRVEAAFLLLPAFAPEAGDAVLETLPTFRRTAGSLHHDLYRRWRFGEAGLGWWDGATAPPPEEPEDPEAPPPEPGPPGVMVESGPGAVVDLGEQLGVGRWAQRSRPARADLARPFEEVDHGARAMLGIVVARSAPDKDDGVDPAFLARPRVLDADDLGHVHWVKGGWRLAEDELAVVVEAEDPNDWDLGGHRDVKGLNGGRARLVEWLAGTATAARRPVGLVLLATVEDDGPGVEEVVAIEAGEEPPSLEVDRVASSPTSWRIGRVVDMADRHAVELRHPASPSPVRPYAEHQDHVTPQDVAYTVLRDDRPAARRELVELANSTSFAPFAGQATIPRLVNAYGVGTRIVAVEGRGLDLRGDEGDGSPAYPRVVQVTWRGGRRQETVLQLTDARAAGR